VRRSTCDDERRDPRSRDERREEAIVPVLIAQPTIVEAAGTPPKRIEEYVGAVNTGERAVSTALMQSPEGWSEPGQRPEFDEYTIVIRGRVRVAHDAGVLEVGAGQAVLARAGEWVQYSTPAPGGAEYVSVCLPAFSPGTVNRDE
jgi:mannose-6-phosphate isomerase-like protein (cupin superfamily)